MKKFVVTYSFKKMSDTVNCGYVSRYSNPWKGSQTELNSQAILISQKEAKREFTDETELNDFLVRLHDVKIKLAFRNIGVLKNKIKQSDIFKTSKYGGYGNLRAYEYKPEAIRAAEKNTIKLSVSINTINL